jgi:putative ABC transport system permease protein
MLGKFAFALLFKRGREWLMPLVVVALLGFFLFLQLGAFSAMKGEIVAFCEGSSGVDLWIKIDHQSSNQDLVKLRRLPDIQAVSYLYKSKADAYTSSGVRKECTLLGVDESTYLGLPSKALYGSFHLKDEDNTLILSQECAKSLFKLGSQKLRSGSVVYMNEKSMKIGGVAPVQKGFVAYTNFSRAKELGVGGETLLVVKAVPFANLSSLKQKIEKVSGLKSYTKKEFSNELIQTEIREDKMISLFSSMVTFAVALALGIYIAAFTNFFKGQAETYAIFKIFGATPLFISSLLALQALVISSLGSGIAFSLYTLLQIVFGNSGVFSPLTLGIVTITFISALSVSLVTSLFISFRVKETS